MVTTAEREPSDRSARETARHQMPRALREEVRLVGDALGHVIAEHGGADLLDDVENLRRTVISARAENDTRGGYADAADKLVSSWSLDRAEQVARAFTCYFHLVNLAEERYRARALREADYDASGPAEALTAALGAVRAELGGRGSRRTARDPSRPSGVHRASDRSTPARRDLGTSPGGRAARAARRSAGIGGAAT